jgi:hypothetical protein
MTITFTGLVAALILAATVADPPGGDRRESGSRVAPAVVAGFEREGYRPRAGRG